MTMTQTVKKMLHNILLHFFIALACGLPINALIGFDTQAAFITGLCLGAAVSAVKTLLIGRGIDKSLSVKSAAAGLYAVLQITLRNILSAGVLLFAVFAGGISFWGVAAGLTLLPSAAFTLRWKGV